MTKTDALLQQLIDIQNKTFFLLREMAFKQYSGSSYGTLSRVEFFKELGARLCTGTRTKKPATSKKPVKRKVITKKKGVKG